MYCNCDKITQIRLDKLMKLDKKLAFVVGLIAVGGISSLSQAATLSVSGVDDATPFTLGSSFNPSGGTLTIDEFINLGGGATETFNNEINFFDASNKIVDGIVNGLTLSGPAALRFTYLGTEAGNNNLFDPSELTFNGETIFDNKATGSGANQSVTLRFGTDDGLELPLNGLLSFGFITDGQYTGNDGAIAANDDDVGPGLKLGFSSQIFTNAAGLDSILVFLGDGAGDSDFDDMVIGIGVFPVPVPAAFPLLATGLVAFGFLARRRKANASKE